MVLEESEVLSTQKLYTCPVPQGKKGKYVSSLM